METAHGKYSYEMDTAMENTTVENTVIENTAIIDVFKTAFFCVFIFITIVGNAFVMAAILISKKLQVQKYLIFSLNVADFMVAGLIMPLAATYEINSTWTLGPELCDLWTTCDVFCCTASILHLVAIAVDRYWAVTNISYGKARNPRRIGIMIVTVWIVSLGISLAPQLGWKDSDLDRMAQGTCLVSQHSAYQIFATCATFYVLLAILVLYWKIFQAARERIRKRPGTILQPPRERRGILSLVTRRPREESTAPTVSTSQQVNRFAKRERKAAKTLVIITGAFVACWLPFFFITLLQVTCESCKLPETVSSIFLWLGYFNSTLNPVIYTMFSPEFRQAFKRMLCGGIRGLRLKWIPLLRVREVQE